MVGLLNKFDLEISQKIKGLLPPSIEKLFFKTSPKNQDVKLGTTNTKNFRRNKAVVFIASPCSASNTALNVISESLNLPIVRAKVESGFGHNIIHESYSSITYTHILYQHCFPTRRNIKIISKVAIPPCLLSYRNVYDWVVSMSERFIRVGRSPTGISFDENLVNEKDFKEVSDYIINFELSWYIRFLNGWLDASDKYEKIKLFPLEFSRIVDGTGLDEFTSSLPNFVSEFKSKIEMVPKINFNKGKSGRGVNKLSESQMALINKKMDRIPISHKKKLPGLIE